MTWEIVFQIAGLILGLWAAGMTFVKYKADREDRLEDKKVNSAKAMKAMEKELGNLQFDQMDAKIRAVENLFKQFKEALRDVATGIRESNEKISATREELIAVKGEVKSYIDIAEKRLNDALGRVRVIEDKIERYKFKGDS